MLAKHRHIPVIAGFVFQNNNKPKAVQEELKLPDVDDSLSEDSISDEDNADEEEKKCSSSSGGSG